MIAAGKQRIRFVVPVCGIPRDDGSILSPDVGQIEEMSVHEMESLHPTWYVIEEELDQETPTTTLIFQQRLAQLRDVLLGEGHSFPSPEHAFASLTAYPLACVRSWTTGKSIPMYAWRALNILAAVAELNGVRGLMYASLEPIEDVTITELGLRHYYQKRQVSAPRTGEMAP